SAVHARHGGGPRLENPRSRRAASTLRSTSDGRRDRRRPRLSQPSRTCATSPRPSRRRPRAPHVAQLRHAAVGSRFATSSSMEDPMTHSNLLTRSAFATIGVAALSLFAPHAQADTFPGLAGNAKTGADAACWNVGPVQGKRNVCSVNKTLHLPMIVAEIPGG